MRAGVQVCRSAGLQHRECCCYSDPNPLFSPYPSRQLSKYCGILVREGVRALPVYLQVVESVRYKCFDVAWDTFLGRAVVAQRGAVRQAVVQIPPRL